ncbi:S-layer protein (fragment) [Hyella patelloides LEGE 07179]|uniref:S-layer protein n=1 Tax=Hyella patelloides LEGE 07179 TaxID=945734 RepID=A0A563VT09_9CYAN
MSQNRQLLIFICLIISSINGISAVNAQTFPVSQVPYPSVSKLKDVAPSDWAYEAVQLLIDRYGIVTGYSDNTFKGNQSLTRYEFAAALNEVLQRVEESIAQKKTSVSSEDLATLQRLKQEFNAELVTLESRVNELKTRTNFLEANFSF